ncbi:MAG: hypothetical protein ACLSGS_05680 [Adlercreutzia sp.]
MRAYCLPPGGRAAAGDAPDVVPADEYRLGDRVSASRAGGEVRGRVARPSIREPLRHEATWPSSLRRVIQDASSPRWTRRRCTTPSTAFTDGGQFGLGAEIGISTQKIRPRAFAADALTSYKYVLSGAGQVRA